MLPIIITSSRRHNGSTPAITGTTTLVSVITVARLLVEDVVIAEYESEFIIGAGVSRLVLLVTVTRLPVEDVVIVECKSELIVVCTADSDGAGWMYTLVDI